MTRGCQNKCSFCAVPKLEPKFIQHIPIKGQLLETTERFGEQKDLLLLDNNVLYSPCFDKIIDEIKDCCFVKGATYLPPNQYTYAIKNLRHGTNKIAYIKKCVSLFRELLNKCENQNICKNKNTYFELYEKITEENCYYDYTATPEAILKLDEFIAPFYEKYVYKPRQRQRYVDFNQGVDARLIVKFPERMKRLAEISIRPLRIAFDSWEQHETYEEAVCIAVDSGIKDLSNYMLYNSNEADDIPVNLFLRMKKNVELCEKKYFHNRDFIGNSWSRKYIRAVQAVLNATHGKIGRGKSFFDAAFGCDEDEFQKIMLMPEAFIIQLYKYADNLTAEWWEKVCNLNKHQYECAMKIILTNRFTTEIIATVRSSAVKEVLKLLPNQA